MGGRRSAAYRRSFRLAAADAPQSELLEVSPPIRRRIETKVCLSGISHREGVMAGKNDIWTVVGVGMGGKGLLADLGLNAYRLRAYDKDDAQVAGIRAAGGIHVDGRPPGTFGKVE